MLRYTFNPQGQAHGSVNFSAPLTQVCLPPPLTLLPQPFLGLLGAQGREPWAWCDGASGPISLPSVWLSFN